MLSASLNKTFSLSLISKHQDSKIVLEGNVLFNDALNTFYLLLYGVGHMVKGNSDKERERERKPAAATWATISD